MFNRNSSRTISLFRREKFKISEPVTSVFHDHLTFSMSYLICLTFIHIFQVQYLSRRHVMPFISSALFKNKIFHFIYLASSTQNAWSRSNRDKLSSKKLLSRIVSPFRVDVAGLLFSLPLIYEIYPRHIFSGNFSHEREFRDEVFVIAVNCTQSLSIPLVKKSIN